MPDPYACECCGESPESATHWSSAGHKYEAPVPRDDKGGYLSICLLCGWPFSNYKPGGDFCGWCNNNARDSVDTLVKWLNNCPAKNARHDPYLVKGITIPTEDERRRGGWPARRRGPRWPGK
jgi:hypothetical protein